MKEKSFDSDAEYVYIIDQARGQDGWIFAEFSFCVFMDRDEVEVHKNVKRERGQYPAILTEPAWSIKDLLYGIKSTGKMIFVLVYFRALKRNPVKDGAYYCYCAYVLRISRYSDFLSPMLTNTGIFLRGLKLSGESRS